MTRREPPLVAAVLLILAAIAVVVMLFPLYWMFVTSVTDTADLFRTPPHLLPPLHFGVYRQAFADQYSNILTSLIIGCSTVALSLAVAVPSAYALAQFSLRFVGLMMLILLIAQMIPAVMLATPVYLMFNRLGLIDSYVGLILADSTMGIPFAVLLLRAFLEKIPRELREASLVDGATELQAMIRVIVPVARPAIITASLFIFLFSWADFIFALTLTPTGAIQPLTLGIYKYIGAHEIDWNLIMAAAVLASFPAAVLLVVAQRYVESGLTMGAVKG